VKEPIYTYLSDYVPNLHAGGFQRHGVDKSSGGRN
jgi:hypothetical protein